MKIILTILMAASMYAHPIKMSFSKLDIIKGKANMEVRLFLDDLTYHIEKQYRLESADFSSLKSNGVKALKRYIDKNLYLIYKGEIYNFTLTKVSFTDDEKVLIVKLVSHCELIDFNYFTVRNTLMTDAFKKQVNVLTYNFKKYEYHLSILEHTFYE